MINEDLELKLKSNIFFRINNLDESMERIEKAVAALEREQQRLEKKIKAHLLQLFCLDKQLVTNAVFNDYKYIDLSPTTASSVINSDVHKIIIDVSSFDHHHHDAGLFKNLHYFKIPFETLENSLENIPSKKIPIILISEDGLNSIKAANFLYSQGFYILMNVSGGYQYLPLRAAA